MNRTPHVIGGGIGSVRKANAAKREADRKAAQRVATLAAMARIAGK